MTKSNPITSKTLTLIIGILVAIFLFLSAAFFQQKNEGNTDVSGETKTDTSHVLNMIHQGAVKLHLIIDKF